MSAASAKRRRARRRGFVDRLGVDHRRLPDELQLGSMGPVRREGVLALGSKIEHVWFVDEDGRVEMPWGVFSNRDYVERQHRRPRRTE